MKNTKRALRRHHRQRMIRRAMRSYALESEEDSGLRREWALRWYNNMKKCSCFMCGNPRKFEKRLTTQEQRLRETARYEASETYPYAMWDAESV